MDFVCLGTGMPSHKASGLCFVAEALVTAVAHSLCKDKRLTEPVHRNAVEPVKAADDSVELLWLSFHLFGHKLVQPAGFPHNR